MKCKSREAFEIGDPFHTYFIHRENSGFVEGLNNKVKALKRRYYGIFNLKHLFQRIYLDLNGYRLFAGTPYMADPRQFSESLRFFPGLERAFVIGVAFQQVARDTVERWKLSADGR